MSSSIRRRKGDIGRMIFMRRLLVCGEMTSGAGRCGHALHAGVIVRETGWNDEPDAGHQKRLERGFIQRVGELFSATAFTPGVPVRQLSAALAAPCAPARWSRVILRPQYRG